VPSWTPENVRQRTDVVYARHGERAVGLLTGLWFYGDASEIIHGTLYGSLWAFGLDVYGLNVEESPSSFSEKAAQRRETLQLTVDAAVGLILASFVRIVGGGLGQGALVRDSIKALRKFNKALGTTLAALSSVTPNDVAAEPEK
jgi:hypothetical protein